MYQSVAFTGSAPVDEMIRASVRDVATDFGEEYWTEVQLAQDFPQELWDTLAANDWLGITIPEEYGGEGLGIKSLLPVIEEIANEGGFTIAQHFLATNIFGGTTLTEHGSEEHKATWLPKIIDGQAKFAIGVTESEAGINTTNISTTATRADGGFRIDGSKIWISNVETCDRMVLLTRTTPVDEVDRPSQGLSMFLVDPDQEGIEYDEIEHDGWMPHRAYSVYIDDLRVPESALLGEVDRGLQQMFDTLNAERIGIAASNYTTGLYALKKAASYANERSVFGETVIGEYQGVQHPLANAYCDLQAARLMTHFAAWQFDEESADADSMSNMATYQTGKAAMNGVDVAMAKFGGMSISQDVGLNRMMDLVRHQRTAPIPEEMLLNFVAENELDLPRSY